MKGGVAMMEQVVKQFRTFEKPVEGLSFEFEVAGDTYRVRLINDCKLSKYTEFVPRLEFVLCVKDGDWRGERIEVYRKGDLYLLIHVPKNASRDIDIPFILIEKEVQRKYGSRWEPTAWLYYHYNNFDGVYLTVRSSAEFIIEEAIKEGWEIKLS